MSGSDHTRAVLLPTDKHETKLKGVIYFQAIEEVYYDHLRSATKVKGFHSTPSVTVFLIYVSTPRSSRFRSLCVFCFLCFGPLLSQKGLFRLSVTSVCIRPEACVCLMKTTCARTQDAFL